jgi:hypothetical protein
MSIIGILEASREFCPDKRIRRELGLGKGESDVGLQAPGFGPWFAESAFVDVFLDREG